MTTPDDGNKRLQDQSADSGSGRTMSRTLFAGFCIGVSALYIINPTAGLFELLPDNLPLVGNLDEATAAAVFLAGLRYFGIDVTALLSSRKRLDR